MSETALPEKNKPATASLVCGTIGLVGIDSEMGFYTALLVGFRE